MGHGIDVLHAPGFKRENFQCGSNKTQVLQDRKAFRCVLGFGLSRTSILSRAVYIALN